MWLLSCRFLPIPKPFLVVAEHVWLASEQSAGVIREVLLDTLALKPLLQKALCTFSIRNSRLAGTMSSDWRTACQDSAGSHMLCKLARHLLDLPANASLDGIDRDPWPAGSFGCVLFSGTLQKWWLSSWCSCKPTKKGFPPTNPFRARNQNAEQVWASCLRLTTEVRSICEDGRKEPRQTCKSVPPLP